MINCPKAVVKLTIYLFIFLPRLSRQFSATLQLSHNHDYLAAAAAASIARLSKCNRRAAQNKYLVILLFIRHQQDRFRFHSHSHCN